MLREYDTTTTDKECSERRRATSVEEEMSLLQLTWPPVPVGHLVGLDRWGPIGVGVGVGASLQFGVEPLDGQTPQLLQLCILVQDGHSQLGPVRGEGWGGVGGGAGPYSHPQVTMNSPQFQPHNCGVGWTLLSMQCSLYI